MFKTKMQPLISRVFSIVRISDSSVLTALDVSEQAWVLLAKANSEDNVSMKTD